METDKTRRFKIGKKLVSKTKTEWIITDVLGDGSLKAVPKVNYDLAKEMQVFHSILTFIRCLRPVS